MASALSWGRILLAATALLAAVAGIASSMLERRRRGSTWVKALAALAELVALAIAGVALLRSTGGDIILLAMVCLASANLCTRFAAGTSVPGTGIALGAALGVVAVASVALSGRVATPVQHRVWQLALAGLAGALGAGSLLAAAAIPGGSDERRTHRAYWRLVALALWLETCVPLLYAWAGQRLWGTPWSWDPAECLSLFPVSLAAAVVIVLRELSWQQRAQQWLIRTVALVNVFLALAGPQVIRWLAVSSRYLVP